jgi:tRNA(His) 5'-end guanylyltransferase
MNDELGNRMKSNYENRSKTYLTRRVPVIIRLDGRAFHTFTKKFKKPYDKIFHEAMDATMKYLCENIQGCKLGYTQSDEITLLLTDYDSIATDAWFGYGVQKMCSVAASMATLVFNKELYNCWTRDSMEEDNSVSYLEDVYSAIVKGAMFDARCFNIPKDEVANCFIWRQKDATRNAIQMLGQLCFSHNELDKKSQNDIQDMLMTQKGINFNDMPVKFKRGVCCYKTEQEHIDVDFETKEEDRSLRSTWVLDYDIPIFTQDRHYIERFI